MDGLQELAQASMSSGSQGGKRAESDRKEGEKGRLTFYGGSWISLLPFIIFLILIIITTVYFRSISDGALWIPAFMALLIPFFLAKEKRCYADTMVSGMASKEAMLPVVCWLFAGVFSRILRESGLALGVAGVAADAGVNGVWFACVAFLATAVFATASGTGFGTIAAGMGVLYPAGIALGCHPYVLAGAVISGAAFGDNLAPISDTTICSATSQDVDVTGVVRSRLKYALAAGALTLLAIGIAGFLLQDKRQEQVPFDYEPKTLLMLIPVALALIVAIKSGDIVIAASAGILSASICAVGLGLIEFVQIDEISSSTPALFTVIGEGLERSIGGVIYTGLSAMLQVCLLALMLFGATAIMRAGGGDRKLLQLIGLVAKGAASAEVVISLMVIGLSSLMGLNAPAILAVGASFARPIATRFQIGAYRTANLLDAQSNTLVYCLPWTPAVVYTLGFAVDSAVPLSAVKLTPFIFYSYAMLLVMFISIVFGIGRNDAPIKKDR